ncbi:MAG: hypothetical protein ACC641_05070 [Acidiferrobacterales bacterium]
MNIRGSRQQVIMASRSRAGCQALKAPIDRKAIRPDYRKPCSGSATEPKQGLLKAWLTFKK